jgi:hypothetical protein
MIAAEQDLADWHTAHGHSSPVAMGAQATRGDHQ